MTAGNVSPALSQTCGSTEYGDIVCLDYEGNPTDNNHCVRYASEIGAKPTPPLSVFCSEPCPPPPPPPPSITPDPDPVDNSCTEWFSTRCTTSFTNTDRFCVTAEIMNRMECDGTGNYPKILNNTTLSQAGDPSDPLDFTNTCTVRSTCEYSCSERNPNYPACLN